MSGLCHSARLPACLPLCLPHHTIHPPPPPHHHHTHLRYELLGAPVILLGVPHPQPLALRGHC